MPTSWWDHAVDFNGDGRRDIWSDDPSDALASTAAYLAKSGWQRGLPAAVEVKLPASLGTAAPAASGKAKKPTRRDRGGAKASAPSSNAVASPMQGTIVKVAVSEGDTVAEGDLVVVLEAMKMEQPLNAHRAGVVKGLSVEAGQTVASGDTLCEIVDAE